MRPNLRSATVLIAGLLLAACGGHQSTAATATLPPLLIDSKGIMMPLTQAVTKISYRPYIPPRQILAFAVIPPLGGADTPANRGIAIEYVTGGTAMLLSQWPRQNFPIVFGAKDLVAHGCTVAHYDTNALGWTSTRGTLITLQPDGASRAASVDAEAKSLIASGACR